MAAVAAENCHGLIVRSMRRMMQQRFGSDALVDAIVRRGHRWASNFGRCFGQYEGQCVSECGRRLDGVMDSAVDGRSVECSMQQLMHGRLWN